MNYDKWERLITKLNDDTELNETNIVNKIKENLQKIDFDTYQEWKKNEFSLNHTFKFNKDNKCENLTLFLIFNLYAKKIQTKVKITDFLLKAEIQIEKDIKLWSAISNNDLEKVKLLIEEGANPNTFDKNLSTPLIYAILSNNEKLTKTLLRNGANPNIPDDNNLTPLYYITIDSNIALIEILLTYDANPNTPHINKMTSLHYAVMNNNIKLVKILLKKGSDVNLKDAIGNIPLHYAVMKNHNEIIEILIEAGSAINTWDGQGNTALHYAAMYNYYNVIENLIDQGANPNINNNNGVTPISMIIPNTSQAMELIKTFIRCQVRLKSFKSRKLYRLIRTSNDDNFRNDMLNYRNKCTDETVKMKETKINENMSITYYDILVSDQFINLVSYKQSADVLKALKKDLYEKIFPIYVNKIEQLHQKLHQKVTERAKLLDQGQESLADIVQYRHNEYLPSNVSYRIIEYLHISRPIVEYLINDDIENINSISNEIITSKKGTKRKVEIDDNQERSNKRFAPSYDNEYPTYNISNINTEAVNQNSTQHIHQ